MMDSALRTYGGSAIIVAAADTPQLLKKRADMVCDGFHDMGDVNGDEFEINLALAMSDSVVLCPGTFWVNNSIVMASNKSLFGNGAGTVIEIRDDKDANINAIENSDDVGGNDHITIKDLKLDGNSTNQSAGTMNGIYLKRCAPIDSTEPGARIEGCYSEHFRRNGIELYEAWNNTITGNTLCHNSINGVELSFSDHNFFDNKDCSHNGSDGYCVCVSSYNIIADSTCRLNSISGIDLGGSAGSESIHNIVIGNLCQANGFHGILLKHCDNNIVTGNNCLGNSQQTTNTRDEICVDNASTYNNVQGNTCRSLGGAKVARYGININAADCVGNLVTNNDIHDDGFGTGALNDAGVGTVTAAGNRVA